MTLTDSESGILFDIDVNVIAAVFDRGPYREVRTSSEQPFTKGQIYRVSENIPEILKRADSERRSRKNET